MREFEKRIILLLRKPSSKILDILSYLISNIYFLFILWLAMIAFVLSKDFFAGIFVVLGLLAVFLLHFIISEGIFKWGGKKFSFERLRPYKAHPELITPIGKKFQDSSLPSSHLASTVGGLVVLVFFFKFFWLIAIILTLLLAWSRLRNGMHYPSDILVGIVLGILYGYLSLWGLRLFFG